MKILDKNNSEHYIEKNIYIENKEKNIPIIVTKKSS
jgi:hypothetical protein